MASEDRAERQALDEIIRQLLTVLAVFEEGADESARGYVAVLDERLNEIVEPPLFVDVSPGPLGEREVPEEQVTEGVLKPAGRLLKQEVESVEKIRVETAQARTPEHDDIEDVEHEEVAELQEVHGLPGRPLVDRGEDACVDVVHHRLEVRTAELGAEFAALDKVVRSVGCEDGFIAENRLHDAAHEAGAHEVLAGRDLAEVVGAEGEHHPHWPVSEGDSLAKDGVPDHARGPAQIAKRVALHFALKREQRHQSAVGRWKAFFSPHGLVSPCPYIALTDHSIRRIWPQLPQLPS